MKCLSYWVLFNPCLYNFHIPLHMKLNNLYDITTGYVASAARDIIWAGFLIRWNTLFWHPGGGQRGAAAAPPPPGPPPSSPTPCTMALPPTTNAYYTLHTSCIPRNTTRCVMGGGSNKFICWSPLVMAPFYCWQQEHIMSPSTICEWNLLRVAAAAAAEAVRWF